MADRVATAGHAVTAAECAAVVVFAAAADGGKELSYEKEN